MPKRKRLNLVRVWTTNQIEGGGLSSPSVNNEVQPSQQPTPSINNEVETQQPAVLEEIEPRAPFGPLRKPRGPTLMTHIWELERGVKVNVIFDANCHPIGKEGCTLIRFLGTVARKSNVAPISYIEWRDMPESYKDDMWKIIESKFHIDESRKEQIKNWIMTDVNDKWKSYKSELKNAGYDPLLTVDEMYEKIDDPGVDKEQFRVLAEYWCGEKGEESLLGGTKPSRAELYILSQTKKDGGPVIERASQLMEQLQKCMTESSCFVSVSNETTSWQGDIFSKVKGSGKKGRVRCLGKVPTSKKSIPSTSTNSNVEQRLSKLESMLNGLMHLMKTRFPDENMTDILQAANQLATANRLDREVPDANSGQSISQNNCFSSHSSHHLLSQQNESNEENARQRD